MGLIREVSAINRALDEKNRLLSTKKKQKIQDDKLINDIKNECKAVIYGLLESDKESDVFEFLDENIAKISDYIVNKKELKQVDYIDGDDWKTKKELVNAYNINDIYQLELIIQDIYIKEYQSVLKIKKIQLEAKRNDLEVKLIDKFKSILKLDDNKKGIFEQLEREEIKGDLINEITNDKDEKAFFSKIYYKTLNELKKGYKYEIKRQKETKTFEECYQAKRQKYQRPKTTKKKTKGFGGFLLLGTLELLNIGNKRR